MASLPVISVFNDKGTAEKTIKMPAVFSTPIRLDIIQQVFKSMNKNARQAYAVSVKAGHQTSAQSWGTGRAVARIPRVSGGGTSRSGQAAFGNMCRGGRMFAPTKVWRKWHVKINQNQKRFATCAALAASALPALVMARGHLINEIEECPLVVSSNVEGYCKTKKAVQLLKTLGAYDDVVRVVESKTLRAGKGKMRNRRFRQRRGPLVIYGDDEGLVKAIRNIPGIEHCQVSRLNLLQLAPGGHVGRFIIWTENAISQLDAIYGSSTEESQLKKGYVLPRSVITNPDLGRIINSEEIQSVLKPKGAKETKRPFAQKKNALKNKQIMMRFNPYARVMKEQTLATEKANAAKKNSKKVKNETYITSMLQ